jgi:glutathione S-transferase
MLQELEIDFDAATVNLLAGEHRQPAFLKINPAGKIPALEWLRFVRTRRAPLRHDAA